MASATTKTVSGRMAGDRLVLAPVRPVSGMRFCNQLLRDADRIRCRQTQIVSDAPKPHAVCNVWIALDARELYLALARHAYVRRGRFARSGNLDAKIRKPLIELVG